MHDGDGGDDYDAYSGTIGMSTKWHPLQAVHTKNTKLKTF